MKTLLILVFTIGSMMATIPADATKSKFSLLEELKVKDDHRVARNNIQLGRKLSGGSNGVDDVKDSNPTVGNVPVGERNNNDTADDNDNEKKEASDYGSTPDLDLDHHTFTDTIEDRRKFARHIFADDNHRNPRTN